MANYLVASGSRKISDLEVASTPIPNGSGSVMPLVIGDTFPITNGTSVQIQTRDFIDSLVFDANGNYTGNNIFSGNDTFTKPVLFQFTGSNYVTSVEGGKISLAEIINSGDGITIRAVDGEGIKFEDFDVNNFTPQESASFMEVGYNQGNIQFNRETHFSNDVYITGSLRVQEIFYVFETASILNSSGSTQFGDTIDDKHTFTGSILLTGSIDIVNGGLIDGVDLSVFSSSVQTESGS
jgi:hypothetical protein